jgi:hypothetical protein
MAKKTTAAKATKPAKPNTLKKSAKSAKPKTSATRVPWLDPKTQAPLIDDYAREMESYLKAFADGVIEDSELKEQEEHLTALMKEVEPQLDDALHEKVTRLLCEVAVYDMMQMVHSLQKARPVSTFRG